MVGLVLGNGGIYAGDLGSFKDAPKTGTASYEALNYVVEKGYLAGIDGELKAQKTLTRAELATILAKAYGKDVVPSDLKQFKDVKKDAWYYEGLAKAYAKGYIKGKSKTIMAPNEEVSRLEAYVIIARASGHTGGQVSDLKDLTDKVPSWAVASIGGLVKAGVIKASAQGSLDLGTKMNRGDFAATIHQADKNPAKNGEEKKPTTPKSVIDIINAGSGSGSSGAVTEIDRTPKYTEGVFYGYGSGFVDTKPMPFRVTIDSNKQISDIVVEPSEIASAYHKNTSGAPIPADNIDDGTVYSAVLKGEGRPEGKSIAALTLNKPLEEAVENLTILADIHELKGKVLAVYKKNTLSKLQLEKAIQEGFGDPSYKLDRASEALQPPLEEEGEVQDPIPPESDLLPGFNSDRIISLVYHFVKEHYKEFNTRDLANETEKAKKLAKINAAFDAVSGATATGAGAAKTVLNALKKSNEAENIDITDIRIKSSNQREASSTRYFDYKDGESLSLDNIAVTLYKKDGSTVDVPFSEFDQHGLKVIDYLRGRPVFNGMTLSISELGENYIHLGVLHESSESLKMLPVYIIQAEASQQKELFVKSLEMREKGTGSWENVEFVKESDGSANRSQRITLPANVVNKLEGKEVEFRYVAKEGGGEGQTHYLNALLTNRDQLEFTGYENQIKIEDDILKDNKETGQPAEYKLSRDSYESMLFYFTKGQAEPPQAKEEYSYTISANLYRKENGGAVNPKFTEKYGTFYSADGDADDFEIAQDKQIDFEVKISKDGNVISVTPVAKPEYQATDRDKPYWDRFLKWLNKEDKKTGVVTHKFAGKSQGDVENMKTWRTEDNYEDRIDVASGATITSHMAKVAVLDAFEEYEQERAAEGDNQGGNTGGDESSNDTPTTTKYSSDKLVKPKSDTEAFNELKTYLSAEGKITNEALAYLDSVEISNERNYHVKVVQDGGLLKVAVISTTDNSPEVQEAVRLANEFIAKFWADTWDGYYDEMLSYFRNLDSRRQYVARTQPNDLELFDNTVEKARLELNLALVAILKELPHE